ncbi:Retrovirus-related Pol polyprotein from transposon TNT 1-94 [Vitis vinifera]|uniref:Retrovirus-related Pol polyprotein from transposon TNT 1-94 n=1 Tax=Vitis vinifera TaxID=29760 RepID=A0A438HUL2_VITVI|nr:Retrovirus-related Pol polyprotein from transposon TNT 1-94 [Vitis vinifera]
MATNNISLLAPEIFAGENYQIWSVKRQTYLETFDLLEVVAEDKPIAPLPTNPTLAQIKAHTDKNTKKFKAKTLIQNPVADLVFHRIMNCRTTKKAWDKLKLEYQGSDRTKQMQVLNLERDFESLTMQEDETITKYSDRIALIVNKIRSLGEEFPNARIVEKILVTLLERFESKISSLEESRNLSQISLVELMNALQAQEQRRALRKENVTESAFQMHTLQSNKDKNQFNKKKSKSREKSNKEGPQQKKYATCSHCKKTTHLEKYFWWRPNAMCGNCKQFRHVTKLIDSGCTHHMCHNATVFKDLDKTYNSTVKVGNGGYVDVKGRDTVAVKRNSCIKLIFDVLFVPVISQNLLSVGQMLEKQYSLQFKDNQCIIFDPYEEKLLCVKMKSKNFAINWENAAEYAYVGVTQSVSNLWHKRFGHFNQRGLVELKKLELVEDMPNVSDEAQIFISYELLEGEVFNSKFCINPLEPISMAIERNVKVDEVTTWVWQNKKDAQSDVGLDNHEDFQTSEFVDDFPLRGTRSLEDIYQRYDTIRLLCVLAAQNSWHIHQLDIKSAFLNGFVDEEIYVEQPNGVVAPGKKDYVYLLRKALYGLKQTPRAWYETMDKHLTKLSFVISQSEATLYVKTDDVQLLIVSLYLDNMFVTGNQPGLIQSFKDEMNKVFEMTNLGVMKYFLGMEVM